MRTIELRDGMTCEVRPIALGPIEARIRWENDPEPYDLGDGSEEELREAADYVDVYGVMGCIVETRAPGGSWEHGPSLWGIVGDAEYRAQVEREMLHEV